MSELIVNHLSGIDRNLGGLIRAVGPYGLKLSEPCHPFESLAEAIMYQQLHASAARAIHGRFVATFGNGTFPTPTVVLGARDEALRAVGLSFSKIAALKDLAAKTVEGIVPEREVLVDLEDAVIIERLTAVRGIGRWTVEMLLMFQLGRPDILPVDDFGVRAGFQFTYGLRKMPVPKALAAYGERWGPHRSAAAWYLWRAVELRKAGTLPVPIEQIRLPRIVKVRRRKAAKKSAKRGKAKAAPRKQARKRKPDARAKKAKPKRARK